MIVITGPGRSGTSFLAKLYKELGFDPGGAWFPEINAGFEAPEIVQANAAVLRGLGIRGPQRALPAGVQRAGSRVARSLRAWLRPLRTELPGLAGRTVRLARWDRLDPLAARLGPRLRELAETHPVAKDPRFSWALPAWAAAGARIDHVVVCVRALDSIVASRIRARQLSPRSAVGARNLYAYGLGLCLTTVHDHRLSHAILRFPDFLGHREEVYAALRFPSPVTEERFAEVFRREARPELVNH